MDKYFSPLIKSALAERSTYFGRKIISSKAEMKTLFNGTTIVYVIHQIEGKIKGVMILGYKEESFLGKEKLVEIPEDERNTVKLNLAHHKNDAHHVLKDMV